MSLQQWEMKTRLGPLYLVASATGLQGVYWSRRPAPLANSLASREPAVRVLAHTVAELTQYMAGQRRSFTILCDAVGTPFQKRVWAALREIPYGETRSYADIARRIGRPRAVRAVGTANGRNPFSILVPCHRVIASDGSLGGYAGGLEPKSRLLALERGA